MNDNSKQLMKVPTYISLLLVIALGISLAKLIWLILTPTPNIAVNINASSSPGSISAVPTKTVNYGKIIADQHLFGEVKKAPVTTPINNTKIVQKPKPTKLNLKLHGIVAYTNKAGFALISTNGGAQKVYAKGDKINDDENIIINNLFPDKVVINNHGTMEELLLPRKSVNKPANRPVNRPSNTPHRLLPGNRAGTPPQIPTANSPRRNQNLSNFRKEVLKNPEKLLDVANPSPAIIEDEFVGFRLQPGSNRKIFRQIGLRANDIITSVNGIQIDEASKGAMVLGELSQATSVTLTVLRGKETLTLSHDFSQ